MRNSAKDIESKLHGDGDLTHRAASAAHHVIDEAAEKAEPVERRVREQAAKAGEKIEARQEAAIEQLERSVERLESFIKHRPVAATGIAFAVGALAAIVLRR